MKTHLPVSSKKPGSFLLLVLLVLVSGCQGATQPPPSPIAPMTSQPTPQPSVEFQTYDLPQARVYLVKVPPTSGFGVTTAITPGVAPVETFARQGGAIAAVNGGFFDPSNQQSTSYVTIAGRQVADPRQNDRLVQNPDLAPYLEKILNRSEFRRYSCQSGVQYAVARQRDPVPEGCQLRDAIGGGPQLLPADTSQAEGFVAVQNGTILRDAIGHYQRNSRSAIGLTSDGTVVIVMVAQRPTIANSGMSLPELATWLRQQGVVAALNLDGGTSSALYYQGKVFQGKVDDTQAFVSRPVKSVVLVEAGS